MKGMLSRFCISSLLFSISISVILTWSVVIMFYRPPVSLCQPPSSQQQQQQSDRQASPGPNSPSPTIVPSVQWRQTTVLVSPSIPFDLHPPSPVPNADAVAMRLSRYLNDVQRRLQQQLCSVPGVDYSETGGWCQRAVRTLHLTDYGLATALSRLLANKTVLSLGEGLGLYRQQLLFNSTSKVTRYDAFDGAPFSEETTNGSVQFLDLTLPQYWLPRYDWVLCLEVAEHVPPEHESTLIDNIVRPAISGIVLSWAVPLQPGARHVNPRLPEYVNRIMKDRGFELDLSESLKLRAASQLMWFQNNTSVYRRSR